MMALKDVAVGALVGRWTGLGAAGGALAGALVSSGVGRNIGRAIQGDSLVKPTTWALKRFYRMTFELQSSGIPMVRHTLLLNPEDHDMDEPARVTVSQTLGGAYVEDFGAGLPVVTITGTTGYKARYSTEGLYVDGYEEFVLFRKNCYRDFVSSQDPNMELHWYDWENNEHYQIQPLSFRLRRNARRPTLYQYEYKFICIRRRGVPFAIFDSLVNDPNLQLLGSVLGGSKSGLTRAVVNMGITTGGITNIGSSLSGSLSKAKAKATDRGVV